VDEFQVISTVDIRNYIISELEYKHAWEIDKRTLRRIIILLEKHEFLKSVDYLIKFNPDEETVENEQPKIYSKGERNYFEHIKSILLHRDVNKDDVRIENDPALQNPTLRKSKIQPLIQKQKGNFKNIVDPMKPLAKKLTDIEGDADFVDDELPRLFPWKNQPRIISKVDYQKMNAAHKLSRVLHKVYSRNTIYSMRNMQIHYHKYLNDLLNESQPAENKKQSGKRLFVVLDQMMKKPTESYSYPEAQNVGGPFVKAEAEITELMEKKDQVGSFNPFKSINLNFDSDEKTKSVIEILPQIEAIVDYYKKDEALLQSIVDELDSSEEATASKSHTLLSQAGRYIYSKKKKILRDMSTRLQFNNRNMSLLHKLVGHPSQTASLLFREYSSLESFMLILSFLEMHDYMSVKTFEFDGNASDSDEEDNAYEKGENGTGKPHSLGIRNDAVYLEPKHNIVQLFS